MNIIIVGQKWLGEQVFKSAIRDGYKIIQVVAPEGDRLYTLAMLWGYKITAMKSTIKAEDLTPGADVIVAAHNHCYIDPSCSELSKHGVISYHPSLLPLHRGRDAVRWSIHMRERVTGGTVYWCSDQVDAGPIAAQEFCLISAEDTASSLWTRKLAPMGVNLILKVLSDVSLGIINRAEQDEALATWEPAFKRISLKP